MQIWKQRFEDFSKHVLVVSEESSRSVSFGTYVMEFADIYVHSARETLCGKSVSKNFQRLNNTKLPIDFQIWARVNISSYPNEWITIPPFSDPLRGYLGYLGCFSIWPVNLWKWLTHSVCKWPFCVGLHSFFLAIPFSYFIYLKCDTSLWVHFTAPWETSGYDTISCSGCVWVRGVSSVSKSCMFRLPPALRAVRRARSERSWRTSERERLFLTVLYHVSPPTMRLGEGRLLGSHLAQVKPGAVSG